MVYASAQKVMKRNASTLSTVPKRSTQTDLGISMYPIAVTCVWLLRCNKAENHKRAGYKRLPQCTGQRVRARVVVRGRLRV